MSRELLRQTVMVLSGLGNEGATLILSAQKARIRVAVLNHYPGVKSSFARRKSIQW